MPTTATLTLPWPPTANMYWRHVVIGKRAQVYVSKEGKEYQINVAAAVLSHGWPRFFEDKIAIEIVAYAPDHRLRDIDNLLKPTLDALARADVFSNDNQVDNLSIRRGNVVPGAGHLIVTIRSVETAGLFEE